ncbi:MAG: hypothetical protein ICV83_35040 [Cytophagales bacterium]|nr:hypothetical protein [Cytophagales bacterium]
MRISTSLLLLAGLLFACGCAGTRTSVNPRILNYNYTGNGNGVALACQYGMRVVDKNKRYVKKEVKKNTRVVFRTLGSQPVALRIDSQVAV